MGADEGLGFITGGQTGVDRGVLDACLEAGFPCGGWCPRGRRAEDGPIPARYRLRETPGDDYGERTECNILAADATVILHDGPPAGGTRLSRELAAARGRPWLAIDLRRETPEAAAVAVVGFLATGGWRTLNWSGPRASESPLAYPRARAIAKAVIHALRSDPALRAGGA